MRWFKPGPCRECEALRAVATAEGTRANVLQEQVGFLRNMVADLQARLGEAVAPGSAVRLEASRRPRAAAIQRTVPDPQAPPEETLAESMVRKRREEREGTEVPLPGYEYRGAEGKVKAGKLFEAVEFAGRPAPPDGDIEGEPELNAPVNDRPMGRVELRGKA